MTDEKKMAFGEWVRAGGVTIAPDAVLLDLKLGAENRFLDQLMRRKIAVAIAEKRGLSLSHDELEDAVAQFYADREVFEQEHVEQWCEYLRVEQAAVREYVAQTALVESAKQRLITDPEIEKRFAAERHDYARAQAEVFEFATLGRAKEFILAVREHEVAAEGGTHTKLTRREAPQEIAALLFSVDAGELVGPVETDEAAYEVYLLKRRDEAILDDDMREEIRNRIFQEIIEAELTRDPIRFVI